MKAAFIMTRLSQYRLLGPVIDRALESGWRVECWHHYGRPREGAKGYQFPAADAVPVFEHGRPEVRSYGTSEELVAWLERMDVDVVISMGPLEWNISGAQPPTRHPSWICVQQLADTFVNNSVDTLEGCSLLALKTPWWIDWAASYFAARGGSLDTLGIRARLSRPAAYVGFPEVDAQRLIDRDEVRRRWHIPPNQPVVVLLPFPQGVGWASFWPKKIFGEPSRVRRLLHVIRHREFSYWWRAFRDASEAQIVGALREFCSRSGAFLLVKSREKTPIPPYMRAAADLCLYDESHYPATILEALSVASLCVSFYSGSVLEAAALSVPSLCVTFRADDYLGRHLASTIAVERLLNRESGGLFEFPGVSKTVTPEEAIAELETRTLSDFAVDRVARQAYVRTFIGDDDGRAAVRLVEAIELLHMAPSRA